jgi:hypothetical protein
LASYADAAVKGINIAMAIYESYKTTKFRNEVQQSLKRIEAGIERIEEGLNRLDRKLTYWEVLDKVSNPTTRIDTHYANWDQKLPPNDCSAVCDDISDAMTQMFQVICGQVDGFAYPILHYYVDSIDPGSIGTTKIENAYIHFNAILIGKLLRGFSLLGAYKDPRFERWYELFKNGDPDSTEEYRKKPYFLQAGTLAQNVVSNLADANAWVGADQTITPVAGWSFDRGFLVQTGTTVNLPEGNVVMAIDFNFNSESALTPQLFYGKLNKYGYAEYSGFKLGEGGAGQRTLSPDWSSGAPGFDGELRVIPDDCVILDVSFRVIGSYLDGGLQSGACFGLAFKIAEVKDGVIDSENSKWVHEWEEATDFVSLKTFKITSYGWNTWLTDPLSVSTPLIGVGIDASTGRVLNNVSFHKNWFDK